MVLVPRTDLQLLQYVSETALRNDEKDEKAFYSVSYTDDREEKHLVFPTEVERMTFSLT